MGWKPRSDTLKPFRDCLHRNTSDAVHTRRALHSCYVQEVTHLESPPLTLHRADNTSKYKNHRWTFAKSTSRDVCGYTAGDPRADGT